MEIKRKFVVVTGAPPRPPAVQITYDRIRTGPVQVKGVIPDELDGFTFEPDTDPPFNHMKAVKQAREKQLVTHCFSTGYYMLDGGGKPTWSNHVACSHPKCGYWDQSKGYDELRKKWAAEPFCEKDVRCPLSRSLQRLRRMYQ